MSDMNNSLNGINSRLDTTEEKISEHEHIVIEINFLNKAQEYLQEYKSIQQENYTKVHHNQIAQNQ